MRVGEGERQVGGVFGFGGEQVERDSDSKEGSDNKMTLSLLSHEFNEVSKMR